MFRILCIFVIWTFSGLEQVKSDGNGETCVDAFPGICPLVPEINKYCWKKTIYDTCKQSCSLCSVLSKLPELQKVTTFVGPVSSCVNSNPEICNSEDHKIDCKDDVIKGACPQACGFCEQKADWGVYMGAYPAAAPAPAA